MDDKDLSVLAGILVTVSAFFGLGGLGYWIETYSSGFFRKWGLLAGFLLLCVPAVVAIMKALK